MSIIDPDNPYRYLEVRGVVEEIVPDPTGAFYMHLNDRYSGPLTEPPADKADRVILVVRPTGFSKQMIVAFSVSPSAATTAWARRSPRRSGWCGPRACPTRPTRCSPTSKASGTR